MSSPERGEKQTQRVVTETAASLPGVPVPTAGASSREDPGGAAMDEEGQHYASSSHFERLGGDPTATLPPMGTLVDTRYELGELLGRGSIGDVYETRDLKTEEVLVIKLLREEHVLARDLAIFEDDAPRIEALGHPVIARLMDWGRWRDRYFVVSEPLGGETVAEALAARRGYPLNVGTAALVARQVALGLAAGHSAGVLARDLKASNVFLAEAGRFVKVADFGLPGPPLPLGERVLSGTPAYLAPERIAGSGCTPATDLFALGVLLYEMFAGQKPFVGDEASVLFQITQAEPRLLRERGAPDGIDDIVFPLLSKRPEDRPETGAEVADRIRGLPFVRF